MKSLLYKYFALILFASIAAGCSQKPGYIFKRTTISMGTTVEIQIMTDDEAAASEAINKAFGEFERLNSKYSTYNEESYLMSLNNNDSTEIMVDDETYRLLEKCDDNYKITEGGFDPAVGNLVKLLGFESDEPRLPSSVEIRDKLEDVGWKHVKLLDGNILRRERKVSLNFNALVKGYAVDRASEIIEREGFKKYLVNAGGEIKTSGYDWAVGIQHPREKDSLIAKIVLNNKAVATSGDYQQFFTKDGRRFTHIIDPATGYPAGGSQSVTVIAEDVMTADALATGLFVLGPETGIGIIEKLEGTEAMIIDDSGKVFLSTGFDKFIRRN